MASATPGRAPRPGDLTGDLVGETRVKRGGASQLVRAHQVRIFGSRVAASFGAKLTVMDRPARGAADLGDLVEPQVLSS
jgi:hypothetical protein